MWPFKRSTSGTSYALIHVGPNAVRGGLVWHRAGEKPALCATANIPLPARNEDREGALERALSEVGDELVCSGGPALRTIAGSGEVSRVIVALEHPWATTCVETKIINPGSPFTYTPGMQGEALAEAEDGAYVAQKLVAATLLNGYLTPEPFGKRANHAELVIFSSKCRKEIAAKTDTAIRRAFHFESPTIVPFSYAATTALQAAHPQLKDFLVILVTSAATEIVSVKRGHVVDAAVGGEETGLVAPVTASSAPRSPESFIPRSSAQAVAAEAASKSPQGKWIAAASDLLKGCATRHALPRTVFIIAEEPLRATLTAALNDSSLHSLWLSDEPVTAVALSPERFASSLTTTGTAEGDTALALLAIYASRAK